MTDRLKPFADARTFLLNRVALLSNDMTAEMRRILEQVDTTGRARLAAVNDMSDTTDEIEALCQVSELIDNVIKAEEEKPGLYDLEAALHYELTAFLLQVSSSDRNARCSPRAAANAVRMCQRQGVGMQSWRKMPGGEG